MTSWPAKAFWLAGASALLVAIPASSQNRPAPESLLPPGFGDPQTLPPPVEKAQPQPRPRPQAPAPSATPAPGSPSTATTGTEIGGVEEVQLDQSALPRPTNYFNVPGDLQRPADMVGPLEPGNFGLGPAAFGRSNGLLLA